MTCILCPDVISVLHFMCSGSSLHVECILLFVFVCVKNNVSEDDVCSVYICWWLNVRENSSRSVVNCVRFSFL